MSERAITVKPGLDIQLSYPDDLPIDVVEALIPAVARAATRIVTKSGANIVSAVVETVVEKYEDLAARVVFYQEYGRRIREEVIPIVAKAKAYQDGRNMLGKMGLDDDILQESQDELNRRRKSG